MRCKFFPISALALLLIHCDAVARGGDIDQLFPYGTPDGRFGTKCMGTRTFVTDQPICAVPFERLIAFPERYDGKTISLVGFLVLDHGLPRLYPSRDDYFGRTVYNFIYIRDGIPTSLQPKLKQGVWVSIIGKFDAKYVSLMELGAIWHANSINETIEEVVRPKPPPEPPVPKL